ncbi:MAG: hypothetical protein J6S20_02630 [Paludibacteraceae bacterium]|jgi:hypothetical protein|nr:hypothetical protein [Paludibacteraceae bacterium]MBO7724335.1 hypothetical protein [Paludibacteraceae bacterium]
MASRKNLKKWIHIIAEELAMECYVNFMLFPNIKEEDFNSVLQKIYNLDKEFISRANHPNGTKETKLVKNYYKSLIENFNQSVVEIANEMLSLNKNK